MAVKRKLFIAICLFAVTSILGSCTKEQTERVLTPTVIPSKTVTATVSPTEVLEDLLPIDEAHFTSAIFREHIAKNYDMNQDGYLSEEERNAVTYIGIGYDKREFAEERLDGFEYFPNLEKVHASQGAEVVLRNLLALRNISGEEGYLGKLTVENCPNVERLYFYSIVVEDLQVSGETAAELDFSHYSGAGHMVLDGNVSLNFEDSDYETENYIYTDGNGDVITEYYDLEKYVFNDNTEWKNLDEKTAPIRAEEVMKGVLNCRPDFFEFEVREMPEGNADAVGNRGWNIAIDYAEAGYKSITFPLYTEEEPKLDNFFVRIEEIQEVRVMGYSPNRGIYSEVKFNLEFVYQTEQEEIVLGERERTYYVILKPDGTSKVYRPLYDDEIRQADW